MGRLEGIRALVTRPRSRAEELCALLEAEGARVLVAPMLEILPPSDDRPLREAAGAIGRYAWVIFASPSAVEALAEATRAAGTFPALQRSKIAVVGPKTAGAARELGLPIARQAETATGLGIYEAILHLLTPADEVLLPAAEEGRLELKEALEASGIKLRRVAAYRAQKRILDASALAELEAAAPRLVLFASPRTAEAFVDSAGEVGRRILAQAAVIAIGPTTANALTALGVPVAAVAEQPTSPALVAAAVRAIHG
jgi:uroporphyrinogen-III synthase